MLLKSFHHYGVACGLVPAPLAKREFLRGRLLRWYLIYTGCLHGVLLLLVPFTFSHYMYEESYISRNFVLESFFNVTNVTRISAMISGGVMSWIQRKALLKLGKEILSHCSKCQQLENASGNTQLTKRIQGLLGQQLFVVNFTVLVSWLLLIRIETDQCFRNITLIVVQVLQYAYVVLLVLHWQSERVRLALKDLCQRVHHDELSSGCRSSLADLRNYFQLYAENRSLLRRVFQTFDVTIVFLVIKMLVTNVNMIYHTVLYANGSIKVSGYTKLLGHLVVITHFWSAVLIMNVVDDITRRSGPKMGYILREFSDLEVVKREFHLQVLY
ncbi:putative gustatory receptor 58a [Drosophila kikkawai]|uniref:Gustatory receptor n=1 Tax=Drosophila kikkawai TaxID=30033 RepID=A0A6P4HT64_DROKI